jgi:hypothetical protein
MRNRNGGTAASKKSRMPLDKTKHAKYNAGMDKNTERPKKRMGRPPMGPDAKNIVITVRISKNELALWSGLAKKRGIGLRTFILADLREATKGE